MNKLNQIFFKLHINYQYNSFRAPHSYGFVLANRKCKRGSVLTKMINKKDKNKHWHLNLMDRQPNAKSVFEKVYRPNKRQNVLDTLFIKNITDVFSTGDVAPEIIGYGIEICGVKVSPCYKILNVYWQIPPDYYSSHEEIAMQLTKIAPRLRAELISRNVMGKVPHIFFIRDITNAKIAEFENALRDADMGPEDQLSIIPDDSFTKDILVFKTPKDSDENAIEQPLMDAVPKAPKLSYNLPQRPTNMKTNVFGLKYDILIGKVLSAKSKPKSYSENSAVISSEFFPSADLFDNIPGTTLQSGEDREKLLKQFQVERKIMKNPKRNFKLTKEDNLIDEENCDDYIEQRLADDGDYIEEEIPPEAPLR